MSQANNSSINSTNTATNNQPQSDIEQAVNNLKVDQLADNLNEDNTATDGNEPQTPVSLDADEQTTFIDDALRTDK